MERALALTDTMALGKVFYTSGLFADVKSEAQAIVKIVAGRELGIPPMQSMMGINIIMGKVSLSGNLIAGLVKRDNRYNYRVTVHTNEKCTVEFYEGGKLAYTSTFTIEDAKKAELLGKQQRMWEKFPRNLLFNRALTNGARIVCPERVAGVYTPDELGAVEDEDGNLIPDTATVVQGVLVEGEVKAQPAGNGHDADDPIFTTWFKERINQNTFWGTIVKGLGISAADAHARLGVSHLNELGDMRLSEVKRRLSEPVQVAEATEPELFAEETAA